jgi:NADH:ubiquinone oxidoreductase subunit F (NADH-binding)/(2Fe-2S) ferredoxin
MDRKPLKSYADLGQLREDLHRRQSGTHSKKILMCMTGCRARGAGELRLAFQEKLRGAGMDGEVEMVDVGCHGQCSRAPLLLIEPEGFLYGGVKPSDIDEIISTTLKGGKPVERLCAPDSGGKPAPRPEAIPFFSLQQRNVLGNCGRIDPCSIDEAIAAGSYTALAGALSSMTPDEVIATVLESDLRGRGGAGFPTGRKWQFARSAAGTEKYLICNADEGDPGAFMDRALLEGTPHQVIEGMLIAGFAIGASHGFIYVRAEYPIAVKHIILAVEQARNLGLLGPDILGSGYDFDIEIRKGSGAFVCGEETALIASLEGRRGLPNPRPPFPAQAGFRGKPTNINNVETLANVPRIITGRPAAKASTKIFALAGNVEQVGLVEVPLGITLRDMVYGIGGGIPNGRKFKAAQIGGPSGGCVPAEHLDLKLDYESVKEVGAIMGSGGLVIMDENTCMVDTARYFMEFIQKESCGKCVPCRVGTRHMADILNRICAGEGTLKDLSNLERLATDVRTGSLCGLGQTAPNPVLTTMRFFRDEYTAHITDRHCPAGVCRGLISFKIDPVTCIGCVKCRKACPADAISGEPKKPHFISDDLCIRCGACLEVCPVGAVSILPGGSGIK